MRMRVTDELLDTGWSELIRLILLSAAVRTDLWSIYSMPQPCLESSYIRAVTLVGLIFSSFFGGGFV
jgi:hypothetical protein